MVAADSAASAAVFCRRARADAGRAAQGADALAPPGVLDVSVQALSGSAEIRLAAAEAGIATVWDLLLRFPAATATAAAAPAGRDRRGGSRHTGQGARLPAAPLPQRPPTFVGVKVGDDSGQVRATWFNQPWVAGKLTPAPSSLVTGKRTERGLAVNQWELVSVGGGRRGAPARGRSSRSTRRPAACRRRRSANGSRAGGEAGPERGRGLPARLRHRRQLTAAPDAFAAITRERGDREAARRRLAFEELFLQPGWADRPPPGAGARPPSPVR